MSDKLEALKLDFSEPSDAPDFDVADVRASIKSLMGRFVGVERHADGLEEACEKIDSFASFVMRKQFTDAVGWELQNMLCTAQMMARSALARTESRGVHFRIDFPEMNDAQWRRHLTIRLNEDGGFPQCDQRITARF